VIEITRDQNGTVRIVDGRQTETHFESERTELICQNLIRFHDALMKIDKLPIGDNSVQIDQIVKRALKKF
jgi:hypothetical protein